jgi:hypothetical protein
MELNIGSARTENNAHQIWHVAAAAQYHQVAIINSATGAIASCPTGKKSFRLPCISKADNVLQKRTTMDCYN